MKPFTLAAAASPAAATAAAMLVLSAAAQAAPPAPPPVFARCAVCHSTAKDAPPKIGPNLWGVYGGKSAHSPKFNYSAAMKGARLKWNDQTLDKWITGPMAMLPGTSMAFPGIKDQAKRAEIIAYLKQLR